MKPILQALFTLSLFLVSTTAQSVSNTTVASTTSLAAPVSLYAPVLSTNINQCPTRDRIARLNQLASVEYVNHAFMSDLMVRFNSLSSSVTATQIGLPLGFTIADVQSNITLIVNQLNIVLGFINSTIPSWCSTLTTEDQADCYVFAPCSNYSFANLSAWSTPATTPAPTSAPAGNASGNASSNASSSSNSSTSVRAPSSSVVLDSVRQGAYFSLELQSYIIATVPLLSNSTLQMQLIEFAGMHAQQASYMRLLGAEPPAFQNPIVLTPSDAFTTFSRSDVLNGFLPFIPDPRCCDGWRGVHAV